MQINTTQRSAMADALVDTIDTGTGTAKLQVRSGAAGALGTDAGTLLGEWSLPNPAFGAAAAGVATAAAISNTTGLAAGTVGHWKVKDRNSADVMQANYPGGLTLNTTTVSVGLTMSVSAFTVTQGAGTA